MSCDIIHLGEEEFITASEGEDEEEESKPKATPTSSIPASSTKVLVDFMLPKVGMAIKNNSNNALLKNIIYIYIYIVQWTPIKCSIYI